MIKFVNAKINIGLDIVRKREDGYHDLSTVFFPVGVNSGTPGNPVAFCDIIEVTERKGRKVTDNEGRNDRFFLTGREVDCPLEKNLFYRAAQKFFACVAEDELGDIADLDLRLDKHLPDGAGLGGGSADAGLTLVVLNEMLREKCGVCYDDDSLIDIAAGLGADCPFFIINRCCYASGIGERLEPMGLDLSGKWIVIVKPDLYVSTREAFAGVRPRLPEFELRNLGQIDIREWRKVVKNDFEESLFLHHPELPAIKSCHYEKGALFSLMSGSGSSVYGIYPDRKSAAEAAAGFKSTLEDVWLLSL